MGEYSKVLSSHEKALAIQQQSLPPNHPDLAMSYNNIGLVYENMSNYSKALSFYERAVDIGQRSLPSNHPNLQTYKRNLERVKKKL
jgi:tetratricopeptide (TPR) repeat protein